MKKLLPFSLCIVVLALVSCQKEYLCTCTTTGQGYNTTSTSSTITASKKSATDTCEEGEQTYTDQSTGIVLTTNCELE